MSEVQRVMVDHLTYNIKDTRRGGMGRVWLLEQAFDEPPDPVYSRQIAVKTFDRSNLEDTIERELNNWISLDHPTILPLRKIGQLNYRLAAIMPIMGGSLDDLIELRGALGQRSACNVMSQVCTGLDFAWRTFKMLHLDLKPSNVLLNDLSNESIKIADWGISKLAQSRQDSRQSHRPRSQREAHTSFGAGTPLYMAPERFSGRWLLSPTADVYSIGIMLVQLYAGTLPFRFDKATPFEELASNQVQENAQTLLTGATPAFREFCLRCIDLDAAQRPSNFGEMSKALDRLSR